MRHTDKVIGIIFEAKGVKKVGLPAGTVKWWREEVSKAPGAGSRS